MVREVMLYVLEYKIKTIKKGKGKKGMEGERRERGKGEERKKMESELVGWGGEQEDQVPL